MLTEEERARLVEIIQRVTAGRSWEDRLRMAEAWGFMSSEVRRIWAQQPQPLLSLPTQLELRLGIGPGRVGDPILRE